MKRFLLLILLNIVFIFNLSRLSAQSTEYWGSLGYLSEDNLGTVFNVDSANGNYNLIQKFKLNGDNSTTLTKAMDGYYYGVREKFGSPGIGIIYRVNTQNNSSQEIAIIPLPGMYMEITSPLIEVSPGELWGLANNTGVNNNGVVYSYNYQTNQSAIEFNFNSIGADFPNGAMVKANGKLYGVTRNLSSSGAGSIYEINLSNHSISKKYTFSNSGTGGKYPVAGMVLAGNGKLYGMCQIDGSLTGEGTIFEYTPGATSIITRHSFNASHPAGHLPTPHIFLGINGTIFGTTEAGGASGHGAVFEFNPNTNSISKIVDLSTKFNKVVLSYQDNNGRILGFNISQALPYDYSCVVEVNKMQGTIAALEEFARVFGYQHITKDSTDRYLLGGPITMTFDSLFQNYNYITQDSRAELGGRVTSPLVQAPDGFLYGYSSFIYNAPVFFRCDPVTKSVKKIRTFFIRDSIYNCNGAMALHPNGKLYLPFYGNGANLSFREKNSGIIEFNPVTDSFKIVFSFPQHVRYIKSLQIDNSGNFYCLAQNGTNSLNTKYLIKISQDFSSSTILRTWTSSNTNFFRTDIVIHSNLIIGLYNESSPKLFKYDINQNTTATYNLSGTEAFGQPVKGDGQLFYGIVDDKIFSYNPSTNAITYILNFSSSFSVAGKQPRTLNFQNGKLFGFNRLGPSSTGRTSLFAFDPLIGISSLQMLIEFDSIHGQVAFGQNGHSPLLLDVCRPADKPRLSLNNDTICPSGTVTITVDSSLLNNGYAWALFEGDTSSFIQSDSLGIFTVSPTVSTWYYIKGIGNCFTKAPFDSIQVIVDSSYQLITNRAETVCKYSDYVNPQGDTLFYVQNNFIDTSIISSPLLGCDSIIYTSIAVDTVDTRLFQNSYSLRVVNQNVSSIEWIDCITDTSMGVNTAIFTAPYNGTFAAVINETGCQDTSACVLINSVGINDTQSNHTVEVFPNPSKGSLQISNLDYNIKLIRIFDLLGKEVYYNDQVNTDYITLELDLPSEIYFLKVEFNSGSINSYKLIIQEN